MALSPFALHVNASTNRHFLSPSFDHLKSSISPALKPIWKELQQLPLKKLADVSKTIQKSSGFMLDVFVDHLYQFVDQPYISSQTNFAPVKEIGEAVEVSCVEGEIPPGFPQGVFVRNGPNPQFGYLQSAVSTFGVTNETWVEGEGMLHALFFNRKDCDSDWSISYNNKYVETETFKLEKQRNRPSFIPAIEGEPFAVLAAILLNLIRLGEGNKSLCNTSVFGHSGKLYAVAENFLPHQVNPQTLDTIGVWDFSGEWGRPFSSHPKIAPGTGELVIMGFDIIKPFCVMGVVSADGKKLLHKVDVKLSRSVITHEIGVTRRYNVIVDHPLSLDITRLAKGGPLIRYEKDGITRIGVMPRYGNSDSVRWFEVETCCILHLLNCFEDGDEVVVRGCRALTSILPGPEWGVNKSDWYSRGFRFPPKEKTTDCEEEGFLFHRVYEWRLNMETGQVEERNVSGADYSMDFPFINPNFTGLDNKYGFTQVIDSVASSTAGITKYGALAKLYLGGPRSNELSEEEAKQCEETVKVEYHKFEEGNFCSGSVFVPRQESDQEDAGWIATFVHNEHSHVTQVHIIDAKNFGAEPIAKITMPQRVPYGFHGTFMAMPN